MPERDIIKRLTRQLAAKHVPNARATAVEQLQKHGVLRKGSETLTALGKHRQAIGPEARAKERAARQTGHAPTDYVYVGRGRVRLK